MAPVNLDKDGAELISGLAKPVLLALESVLKPYQADQAGVRITGCPKLAELLGPSSVIGAILAELLGGSARPVRAILFDKSAAINWALGWHQDRTIALRERRHVPGFANWNLKQGIEHAEPPFAVLQAMLTLRIHLDPVDDRNGALQIIRGSHSIGRIGDAEIDALAAAGEVFACHAAAGDVWIYRTPIIHRSARSTLPLRRRVLQVDYSADTLPGGLEWRGI